MHFSVLGCCDMHAQQNATPLHLQYHQQTCACRLVKPLAKAGARFCFSWQSDLLLGEITQQPLTGQNSSCRHTASDCLQQWLPVTMVACFSHLVLVQLT